MGEPVCHLSRSRCALLSDESSLLLLLPVAHCREISQHRHQAGIIFVERFSSSMSHDKDGAACVFSLPRKQDSIGHQRRFDAENVKKRFGDREVLWVPTFETHPARAGVARQNRAQKSRVLSRRRDPMVELVVAAVFPFNTDSCTIGAT